MCSSDLWTSINLDETYPKEFLDYLHQLVEDIDTGKEKTYTWEEVKESILEWSDEVLDGVDLDEELPDEDT